MSTNESFADTVEGYKFFKVPDSNRKNKLQLIKSALLVAKHVLSLKPDVIVTTGAAPGLMGILVGKLMGAKTIWIDSIANVEKISMSGNIALKIADRVYTQWEHLSNNKILFNGNVLS
ncbi:hypothetical protein SAE01_23840 [Segetibacter aerophilus]|uniref:Oligosaccharide biosynthesis protein Alg14 n=2 Tax=Segetibacter aerophilus TaxID=670293 RepID=A0A512BD52_9BACT|nr:hypothetical protein SAE01_23840 [Segetibacter aerophilus]